MNPFRLGLAVLTAGLVSTAAHAQNAPVTISVDAAANRRAIDPRIYGVAWAGTAALGDLRAPLNRQGGNAATRYNWQLNAANRGFDWYFQSIAESSAVAGEMGDTFITQSRAGGAQPMLTIPMIGWTAILGPNRNKLASFSIAKYGAQQDADWQWFPDAGNGVLLSGQYVVNDPHDANTPAGVSFQMGWVQHLVGRWGTVASGGLRYYVLDNEHSIWHSSHRDVHPTGATMEQIRDLILSYSASIKAIDPGAAVVGPEEWGWSGFVLSGYDQQWGSLHGWSNLPDRAAHGGMDYLPWLLAQLKQNEPAGKRALDVFAVHFYPQGGEFSNDTSAAMQIRRNRSTRALWDPNYTDETWIAEKVRLIPRLRGWAQTHYHADTPIGLTEYNWGAEAHINGATAQADILGIFGREGLDVGAPWTTPDATTPTYKAMKMYTNYNSQGGVFGETSVRAAGGNPDELSSFAALRASDGALTVMLVNKVLSGNTPATVPLANFTAGTPAQVWQLRSTNTIQRLADLPVSGNSLSASLPPQSITLLVIPRLAGTPTATARPTATSTPTPTASPTARPSPTARGTATATARPGATPADSDGKALHLGGDVRADRGWRNDATGQVYLWTTQAGGGFAPSPVATVADSNWSIAAGGDLNGDGRADLVWRHQASGQVYGWLMNGSTILSSSLITTVSDLGWRIAGSGDFTGDGRADLLWRHQSTGQVYVWVMNGTSVASVAAVATVADAAWQIVGARDFDGNGRADVLWRSRSTGQIYVWLMNGTSIGSSPLVATVADFDWHIAAAGDLNGDGRADLVWRKHSTGQIYLWTLNGGTTLAVAPMTTVSDAQWVIVASGDVNADGKADLVWHHRTTGEARIWSMNGATTTSATSVGTISDLNWKMVPLR